MNSIQSCVQELKSVNVERARLRKLQGDLKKQADTLEKKIVQYLNEGVDGKSLPGVKYQDTAILLENRAKRITKSRKETDLESVKILENHGIINASAVLNQILEARKGEKVELQKVKIQQLK